MADSNGVTASRIGALNIDNTAVVGDQAVVDQPAAGLHDDGAVSEVIVLLIIMGHQMGTLGDDQCGTIADSDLAAPDHIQDHGLSVDSQIHALFHYHSLCQVITTTRHLQIGQDGLQCYRLAAHADMLGRAGTFAGQDQVEVVLTIIAHPDRPAVTGDLDAGFHIHQISKADGGCILLDGPAGHGLLCIHGEAAAHQAHLGANRHDADAVGFLGGNDLDRVDAVVDIQEAIAHDINAVGHIGALNIDVDAAAVEPAHA